MIKRAEGLAISPAQGPAHAEPAGTTPAEEAKQAAARAERSAKSRKSVYIYIATLFLVVLLFTLLSYFVQQRNNSEISTLHQKNASAQMNIEDLQNANKQLKQEKEAGETQISALQGQLDDLKKQLDDARRQWQEETESLRTSSQASYDTLLEEYNTLYNKYTELAEKYGVKVTNE